MIAVIGAGITGLLAAYRLKQAGLPFHVFEASDTVGGNILSETHGAYLLDKGPNSLRMTDELYALLAELGLTSEIVYASEAAKNRYILKSGTYQALPSSPLSLVGNNTFSWKAKRKLMLESFVKAAENREETVDAFFRRRLGDEWTDYAVYPFVSGIYAGDPARLLMKAAFPDVLKWEKEEGSVIKGAIKSRKNQQHKGIFNFTGGAARLCEKLADPIQSHIHLESTVSAIKKVADGFRVDTSEGPFEVNQVISTVPAHTLASMIAAYQQELAAKLANISYPSVSLVHMAFKRKEIKHPLDGFGALHSPKEGSDILGTVFSSTVFPGRCPDDEVLLCSFVGGALQEEKADLELDMLEKAVLTSHQQLLGAGEPTFKYVTRWPQAIPQYDIAQFLVAEEVSKLAKDGFHLGGNWIGGISVPNTITRANKIAQDCIQLSVDLENRKQTIINA
ncbi:MAG: protoporphyrinogen oxidase [Bacteroidota bacterium]